MPSGGDNTWNIRRVKLFDQGVFLNRIDRIVTPKRITVTVRRIIVALSRRLLDEFNELSRFLRRKAC